MRALFLSLRFRKKRKSSAFTVVEVLVASAILSIIMIILFNIFNKATQTWIHGQTSISRSSSTRMVFEVMSREISQAIISTNGWTNPATAPTLRFVGTITGVYFVVPVPPSIAFGSDMSRVGYNYKQPTVAYGVTNLVRYCTDPVIADISSLAWNPRDSTITSSTPFGTLPTAFTTTNVVADNIAGFTLTYYDSAGNPSAGNLWDSAKGVGQTNLLPSVIEVTLVILDNRNGPNTPTAGAARSDWVNRYAVTNSTVIHLINAP